MVVAYLLCCFPMVHIYCAIVLMVAYLLILLLSVPSINEIGVIMTREFITPFFVQTRQMLLISSRRTYVSSLAR